MLQAIRLEILPQLKVCSSQRGSVDAEADRQCGCSMKDGIVDRRESGPQKARSIMKNVFIFIALFLRLCIPLHSPLRNTRQSSARSRVIPERFPVAFAVLSFGFLYRSVFPEWRSRGSIMLNFWKYWFHVFGSGFCSERRILNLQLGQGPVMLQTNGMDSLVLSADHVRHLFCFGIKEQKRHMSKFFLLNVETVLWERFSSFFRWSMCRFIRIAVLRKQKRLDVSRKSDTADFIYVLVEHCGFWLEKKVTIMTSDRSMKVIRSTVSDECKRCRNLVPPGNRRDSYIREFAFELSLRAILWP